MMNVAMAERTSETRSRLWLVWTLMVWMLVACNRLDVKQDLSAIDATLVNQAGEEVRFPDRFNGEVTLIGYIYTTCPDICPLTTQRMNEVVRELTEAERRQIRAVGLSMDPDRDTPEVLSRYADAYRLPTDTWSLLSGERQTVLGLLEDLEITVVRTPTRITDSGERIYFLDHTDRVSLIGPDGKIRRHYIGSELEPEEVVRDIRALLQSNRRS